MNSNNQDRKRKLITLFIILFLLCIIAAVAIFLMTSENSNGQHYPTPSIKNSITPVEPSSSSAPSPTQIPVEPKELVIKYENDKLIIEGNTKEVDFTTLFDNDKYYVSDEYRYPDSPKKSSWYEINNISTIKFTIDLDRYNLYTKDHDTIFPDNSIVQKIDIVKNTRDMSLEIELVTDRCIAVSAINEEANQMEFSISEVLNSEFFNYSNVYSRKFMLIPEYQLCRQSDSDILYYEDDIEDGSDELYTIRIPAEGYSAVRKRNVKFELKPETVYIYDGYIEYYTVKVQEISSKIYYDVSFKFAKEIYLYPNANDLYSTITFCDPDMTNVIVVDAGHGGHDPGTLSRTDDKYNEADINLKIAEELEKLLIEKGYTVFMTRNEDIYLGYVLERGDLANMHNAILFLSIHVNSYDDPSVNGISVLWRDEEEKELAKILQKNIITTAVATNRDIMHQYLAIHTRSICPAATMEVGFITNPVESEKLKTSEYQKRLAKGILNGVLEYFELYPIE